MHPEVSEVSAKKARVGGDSTGDKKGPTRNSKCKKEIEVQVQAGDDGDVPAEEAAAEEEEVS